jgi:hypothetical protein
MKTQHDIKVIVGADNGLDGGLCALSPVTGTILGVAPMPTRLRGGKREVCPIGVRRWLLGLEDCPSRVLCVIEEPLKHAKSSQAIRSMAISFGTLCTVAELIGCAGYRMQVTEWQRPVLGRVPKGKTKQRALEVATSLWPDQNWLASSRCRVAHDGMVDAALLAHHAQNTLLTPDYTYGS